MLRVKFFQHKCVLLILLFLTIGCQNTGTTGFLITRGVIENHCKEEITDIKIMHLPTNAVATFSGVLSGTTAEIGFPVKELLAIEAIVIWREGDNTYQKKLQLPRPSQLKTVAPQKLIYSVFTKGIIEVKLVNDI
jgi:hypothetical protein